MSCDSSLAREDWQEGNEETYMLDGEDVLRMVFW